MYKCHDFFIHSSVSGHIGYFHFLDIINSAAMKNGVYGYICVSELWFSQGICPRDELLGHIAVLFLVY